MPHNTSRNSYQRAAKREVLFEAQRGKCACGCRRFMKPDAPSGHADYPTLDHVEPASGGGSHHIRNMLLKRRRCNMRKGNKPPSGRDLAMLAELQPVVAALLKAKPLGQREREANARSRLRHRPGECLSSWQIEAAA